jgi:hypothetical protein
LDHHIQVKILEDLVKYVRKDVWLYDVGNLNLSEFEGGGGSNKSWSPIGVVGVATLGLAVVGVLAA